MTISQSGSADNRDEEILDAAAALALINSEQVQFQRSMASTTPWIIVAWGVTWLFGFGALWLIDGSPAFSLSLPLAVGIFIALMIGAIVVSAICGARAGRGIKSSPGQAFTGTAFGLTCFAGFIAFYAFAFGMQHIGMPRELSNVFIPISMVLLVGLSYMFAGATWRIGPLIGLGAWIVIVASVATFFGYPTHYLILALAGGGGMLIASPIVLRVARNRA